MRVVAHGEDADDHVRQPPGDGGQRGGRGLGVDEVDAAVGMHGPAVGDRLPEVLVIGQAVEAGPQLMRPVEVQLVGEEVGVHAFTLTAI